MQALKTVPYFELKQLATLRSRSRRDDYLDELAERRDIPLPRSIRWNFLQDSIYVGWSKDKISEQKTGVLMRELDRLDIALRHKRRNKPDIVDAIIHFIKNKGIGHDPMSLDKRTTPGQTRPTRPTYAELTSMCVQRGIARGHIRDTLGLQELIAGYDAREEERVKTCVDPGLPHLKIDPDRPKLVLILFRHSSIMQLNAGRILREREKAERTLKSGHVLGGLLEAEYKLINREGTPLSRPMPRFARTYRKDTPAHEWVTALEKAEKNTQVIIVAMGLDGASSNRNGWHNLMDAFHELHFYLIIAEDKKQWHHCDVLWSQHDWQGPIEGRYWACCDLRKLCDPESNVRLYTQIREQWAKCELRRATIGLAHKEEGRLPAGRNGRRS